MLIGYLCSWNIPYRTIFSVFSDAPYLDDLKHAKNRSARSRGKSLGRPKAQPMLVAEIEHLAASTNLSVRQIQDSLSAKVFRGLVGGLTKRVRTPVTSL